MRKDRMYHIIALLLFFSIAGESLAQKTQNKSEAEPKGTVPPVKSKWTKDSLMKSSSGPFAPGKMKSAPVLQNPKTKEATAKVQGIQKWPAKKEGPGSMLNWPSKEVMAEIACSPGATVFLENIFRRVTIRASNDNKVRLMTTIYFQGNPGFSDAEWLQKLELNVSGNAGNVVVVKSGNLNSMGTKIGPAPVNRKTDTDLANGLAIFDSLGNLVNKKSSISQSVILYIPTGAKLDIESKYADVIIEDNLTKLKIFITNGSLTMKDADKAIVTSVYGNIYAGNINNAEVEMINGRFAAKTVSTLDINSKNSTIELGVANQVAIHSNNDQFEIEELGLMKGQKNYGDLRVNALKTSLELSGINANIKIRSIEAGVTLVKIDNQYADLRLPVDNLKNYNVSFEGVAGNIYASFEKTEVTASSFRAAVGAKDGKSTSFKLRCNNCTVDFK